MNKLFKKLFAPIAVFAMALGVSISLNNNKDVVGAEAATTVSVGNDFTAESGNIDTNFRYDSYKGGGTTAPAVSGGDIRLYQKSGGGDGGYITVAPRVADYKMTSFTISASMAGPFSVYYISSGTVNTPDPEGWISAETSPTWVGTTLPKTYTYNNAAGFTHFKVVCNGTSSGTRVYVDSISITYDNFGVPVTGVSIDVSSQNLTLNLGQTHNYTATTQNPEGATVTWSSTNSSVASIVSETGVATVHAPGTTTIEAKITVNSVDYTNQTTLTVLYPEPASQNATIAEILANSEGNAKRKFISTVIIKGFGDDGNLTTATSNGRMHVGDSSSPTENLYVYYATGGDATKLNWNGSTNQYDYTHGANFLTLTLTRDLKIGDQITIESIRSDYNETKEVYAKITDKLANELTSITVTPLKTQYTQGDTILPADFTLFGSYTVAGNVSIPSGDATISPSRLDNFGVQTVTISFGGKQATYQIDVEEFIADITSVNIADGNFTMLSTDAPKQLTYSVLPSNHTEGFTFSSSNELVATVSQEGLVTYVGEGSATIKLEGNKGIYSHSVVVTGIRGAVVESLATDTLTRSTTGVDIGTTYASWSNKTATTNAIFAGQSAGDKDSIQIRSTNSNSGVVVTASAGLVKKVTIEFESSTADGRVINIYGKNTAYTDPTDLYNAQNQGDLKGTIVKGSSTQLTISGNYAFIGLRSNSGAIYIKSIAIEWNTTKTATLVEVNSLNEFMTSYLHMNDYNDNLGYCAQYYPDVKQVFNDVLTENERNFFLNATTNSQYAAAKARLEAWAAFNGDSLDVTTGKLVLVSSLNSRTNIYSVNNVSPVVAVSIIGVLGLSTILIYYFLKKKELIA